jgi:cytochrome c-type biogenesis protein CcmH/NrfG
MPRTWNNVKVSREEWYAMNRRGRPPTVFLVLLAICAVFFFGLTIYATVNSYVHPVTPIYQPAADQPKDD